MATAAALKVVATPVAEAEAPVVEVSPDDEFANSFTSFATDDKPVAKPAVTTEAPAVVEAAPVPAVVKEGEPESEIVAPELDKDGKPVVKEGEPEKKDGIEIAPPNAKDTKEGSDDVIERLIAAMGRGAPAAPQGDTKVAAPPALYSAQEISMLTEFAKEWPDVARAQEVLMRGVAQSVEQRVYREMAAVLGPKLQMLDAMANNMQFSALENRVPGYEAIVPKVEEWIKTIKIPYLKKAYSDVMEGGLPEEIEHLVGQYRQETGDQTGVVARATTVPVPAAKPAPSLSPAAIKAAARLAPVDGKVSTPVTGAPQTFEDGFKNALELLK